MDIDPWDSINYWRFCDELSIAQAALLIVGEDPSAMGTLVEGWNVVDRPSGYEAVKTALKNAVVSGKLEGQVKYHVGTLSGVVDLYESTVHVDHLRLWLLSRGITTGFFFPNGTNDPDYLNPLHENYAPKLAAAVAAWQAVNCDPKLTKGKSVKSALDVWLRRNADRYGLTKEDGNPNETGIEEVAKIANWAAKGGAPKTPSQ